MSIFDFFRRVQSNNDPTVIERGFRGEGIEYKKAGKELEIDFTWRNGYRIYTETINRWTDGTSLSDEEKSSVFSDLLDYLSTPLRRTIVVINTDDPSKSLWEELSRKKSKLIEQIEYDSYEKQREFERQMYMTT